MCNKCNGSCNSCDCTCNQPCNTPDCACKVFITTDCVTLSEDLPCTNIPKGLTETEVLKQLDTYLCERFESVENFLQIINVGGGAGVYKGISVLGKKELRSLISDGTVSIIEGTDTISFSINQNNFVRNVLVNWFDLPVDYSKSDVIAYVLALPGAQRTLEETDSKFNIIVAQIGEGTDIIEIYELQNTGKGIITAIAEDDLLLIRPEAPGFQDVLLKDSFLPYDNTVQIDSRLRFITTEGIPYTGVEIAETSVTSPTVPNLKLGKGIGNVSTEGSISFFSNEMLIVDSMNSRGIEYGGDYEANFLPRTLVTEQHVQSLISAIPPVTGAETKINSGVNVTITGNGTVATPYIISSATPDGSETKIANGSNTTVTGSGTVGSPYQIAVDGSETKVTQGTGITVTGTGTTGSPYVITNTANNSFKVFTALMSQFGTAAPTFVIMENTIGNIVWTRNSQGTYDGTLAGAFTPAKCWGNYGFPPLVGGSDGVLQLKRVDNDTFRITVYDQGANLIDSTALDTPVEIRVYF